MKRLVHTIIFLTTSLILTGCASCISHKTIEVRNILTNSLKIGDDREKIEQILTQNDFLYNYDKFDHKYTANIYDSKCNSFQAVSIELRIDSAGKLVAIKVFESYTAP